MSPPFFLTFIVKVVPYTYQKYMAQEAMSRGNRSLH
jgi:hypothetical protein